MIKTSELKENLIKTMDNVLRREFPYKSEKDIESERLRDNIKVIK